MILQLEDQAPTETLLSFSGYPDVPAFAEFN
jgi:hypothetical protein